MGTDPPEEPAAEKKRKDLPLIEQVTLTVKWNMNNITERTFVTKAIAILTVQLQYFL